jgi:hypothetical protein
MFKKISIHPSKIAYHRLRLNNVNDIGFFVKPILQCCEQSLDVLANTVQPPHSNTFWGAKNLVVA